MLAAPLLIDADRARLQRREARADDPLVRILFPGAGLLVLSAWCLGVLNSHRRFFLSYTAPVVWNVAMIATLLVFGAAARARPAWRSSWRGARWSAARCSSPCSCPSCCVLRARTCGRRSTWSRRTCATVVRNFVPVFVSRGVVQVSAYIDTLLASLLPTGAVTGLANAQLLYTLPVSLFGMSVSAAELPAMSGATRRRTPTRARRCASGSTPACGGSRSSSCRRRWRSWRSAT